MVTRTGPKRTRLQYFLTDLGENHLILGYPWFTSAQPKIDWAKGWKGWIDYSQLPIVIQSNDADKAIFSTRTKGRKSSSEGYRWTNEFLTNTKHLRMFSVTKNPKDIPQRDPGTTKSNSNQELQKP